MAIISSSAPCQWNCFQMGLHPCSWVSFSLSQILSDLHLGFRPSMSWVHRLGAGPPSSFYVINDTLKELPNTKSCWGSKKINWREKKIWRSQSTPQTSARNGPRSCERVMCKRKINDEKNEFKWEFAHNESGSGWLCPPSTLPCRRPRVSGSGAAERHHRTTRLHWTDTLLTSPQITSHSATSRALGTNRHLLLFLKIIYKLGSSYSIEKKLLEINIMQC